VSIALLAVLFLPTIARSIISTRPDWAITDLLINYRAGFVRRGLIGELMLWICNATGVSFFHLAAGMFAVLYAGLIVGMVKLALPLRDRFPILAAMLLLSPALLMFPVHDWPAYLRKEGFFLAILILHALLIRRFLAGETEFSRLRAFYLFVLTPTLTVIMLIHEAQLFFLTAHFCLTFVAIRQRATGAWWLLALYLVPVATAFVILPYTGDKQMVDKISSSVAHLVPMQKGREGAIWALGWPMSEFLRISLNVARNPVYMSFYTVAWALSVVVPAVALTRIIRRHAVNDAYLSPRWLAIYLVLICVSPLPLAFVMSDYGRWIHLTAFSVVAFLLAIPIRQPEPAASRESRFWSGPVAALLVAVYIGAWMLPHYLLPGTPPRKFLKPGLAASGLKTYKLFRYGQVDAKQAEPIPASLVHNGVDNY
jgi:hypothetical protein